MAETSRLLCNCGCFFSLSNWIFQPKYAWDYVSLYLRRRGLALEGASTHLTAQALEAATFYILNNPHIRARLEG